MTALKKTVSNQVQLCNELAAGVAWATGVVLNNQESNSLCIHIWCHRKQIICLSSVSLSVFACGSWHRTSCKGWLPEWQTVVRFLETEGPLVEGLPIMTWLFKEMRCDTQHSGSASAIVNRDLLSSIIQLDQRNSYAHKENVLIVVVKHWHVQNIMIKYYANIRPEYIYNFILYYIYYINIY